MYLSCIHFSNICLFDMHIFTSFLSQAHNNINFPMVEQKIEHLGKSHYFLFFLAYQWEIYLPWSQAIISPEMQLETSESKKFTTSATSSGEKTIIYLRFTLFISCFAYLTPSNLPSAQIWPFHFLTEVQISETCIWLETFKSILRNFTPFHIYVYFCRMFLTDWFPDDTS